MNSDAEFSEPRNRHMRKMLKGPNGDFPCEDGAFCEVVSRPMDMSQAQVGEEYSVVVVSINLMDTVC